MADLKRWAKNMKLPWIKAVYSNEGGRWIEWQVTLHGMRCSRLRRSHFSVWQDQEGRGWHDVPAGRQVKLTMENGKTIDVRLPSDDPPMVRSYLTFAFQCYCDTGEAISPDEPVYRVCGIRLKQIGCRFNFFEQTHPKFGAHFRGMHPDVSVRLLALMIREAIGAKTVRMVGPVLDFDPND